MKYAYQGESIPQDKRKILNEKVLYLIDSGRCGECSISPEDIYNAYTGDGGLHGLERADYENYHAYSEAKKEIENGQFFTPPRLCEFITACLKLSEHDLVADLTCGMGSFFNFIPTEANIYGCELDVKAVKVAKFLYPEATVECRDIRTCQPETRFDYVVGNPPFHLKWWTKSGREIPSQMYYCLKAAEVLKPLGILSLIVPQSFLADDFTDKGQIREMESRFSFLGQVLFPDNAFSCLGVSSFPTKLQFWQKKTADQGWKPHPYRTEADYILPKDFDIRKDAEYTYQKILAFAKSALENNQSKILLELARSRHTSSDFRYRTQKLLYHIKAHPLTRPSYAKCCEYLHRFYTQRQPDDMSYEQWCRVQLTENKVLTYLRHALKKQNPVTETDCIRLVKRKGEFAYKGYSAAARRQIKDSKRLPVPVYQAVLENTVIFLPLSEQFHKCDREFYNVFS